MGLTLGVLIGDLLRIFEAGISSLIYLWTTGLDNLSIASWEKVRKAFAGSAGVEAVLPPTWLTLTFSSLITLGSLICVDFIGINAWEFLDLNIELLVSFPRFRLYERLLLLLFALLLYVLSKLVDFILRLFLTSIDSLSSTLANPFLKMLLLFVVMSFNDLFHSTLVLDIGANYFGCCFLRSTFWLICWMVTSLLV